MAEKDTPDDDIIDVEAAPDVVEEDHLAFEPDPQEEHEEESGIAGKFMIAAGLLVAGGVLALWLGPKIAPSLPSGMAPVANWLAPGGAEVESEIAELRRAIENMPQPIPQSDIDNSIADAVAVVSTDLQNQISNISDQIVVPDNSGLEARISALEAKTEGLRAELTTLVDQLSDVSELGGEVSAETAAQIAAYAATLEGLKAEINALASQNAALSKTIEGVSVAASRQVAEAETIVSEAEVNAEMDRKAAAIRSGLSAIEVALSAGVPFTAALEDIEDAGVSDIPADLLNADGGVITMSQLRADFPDAAHAAIRASIMASSGDGVFSKIGAFAKAQVAGRSLTPQEGLAPDAVLSRAEAALKNDDLTLALEEIEALPAVAVSGDDEDLMGMWIAQATQRLRAVDAYNELRASLEVK